MYITMDTLLGIIIMLDTYAIIYYRLMVKYYYQTENNAKESNFSAIFSFPPHSKLSAKGKQCSRRYWIALTALLVSVALLIPGRDLGAIRDAFSNISK